MTSFIIYSPSVTPRLEYIISTLFDALSIDDYELVTDPASFLRSAGNQINYSSTPISGAELRITPARLLFETEITGQQLGFFNFEGVPAFFRAPDADFPFDIFAAAFFLISRYEEYLPHKKDFYGRYSHENSAAFQHDFLKLPLINTWLLEFRKLLQQKFPSLALPAKQFTFLPTYDIDIAYSYLHKGLVRNLAGFARAMWDSQWSLVKERIDVLFNNRKDPFDSYSWLHGLHEKYELRPLYFFLLAAANKDYDKNILPTSQALQALVRDHAAQYQVGIHPSWQSSERPGLLQKEIETLQKLAKREISKSRQHYIRLQMPETYELLVAAGIQEDYSMGYGSINGFRASYCLPYRWYNLNKEETTALTIYPFCYMDANTFYEQHYNSQQALDEMQYYYQVVKAVSGLLITIWHNQFLGSDKMFTGWKETYENAVQMMKAGAAS